MDVVETGLRQWAELPTLALFQRLDSSPRGLTEAEAASRVTRFGSNIAPLHEPTNGFGARAWDAVRSPFVLLLAALGGVFVVVGDPRGATTVGVMVTLAVGLRIWQQSRSVRAANALQRLVACTATVRRRADAGSDPREREVASEDLVPGDVLLLRPGDVVAADVRIVTAQGLVVDQASLSGESLPVAKTAQPTSDQRPPLLLNADCLCLSGTAVVAGTATSVVIATGADSSVGSAARVAEHRRPESSFDRGVRGVGWTLVRFMMVLAPIVLVVNGTMSGDWARAAMFALAVAVGLTPEMLPVILTTNLARGATKLARHKVVVRRLNVIQDLGAIDVLCVDKTGTLTEDRIVYSQSVDVTGCLDDAVTELAGLAVHFQDGPHNRLDDAIAEMAVESELEALADAVYDKVDEIGFDHARARSSVVISRQAGEHILICKGDPREVLPRCSGVRIGGHTGDLDELAAARARHLIDGIHGQGMRLLAVAVRSGPARLDRYDETDERDLVLVGFVGFVDPVRDSAAHAIRLLDEHSVAVKMLTGDNAAIALRVADQIGLKTEMTLSGAQIDELDDETLRGVVQRSQVFAELAPEHKTRIVSALRGAGQAVGFLGDGVNDVGALRIADAGIAVDSATDVTKRAADLILLDPDLAVVARGVIEGRRTLTNTMKYVKITASSNFGNVLSVLLASVLLPFLPMMPIQLMIQNLLYDTAQLTLPWDRVDRHALLSPQRWDSRGLVGFMTRFGVLSSVFDIATFAVLWWVFRAGTHPALFQTGWFVEGLLTQLLIVLVLRTPGLPWRDARPAPVVVMGAVMAAVVGVLLTFSSLAPGLQLTSPPGAYWLWVFVVTAAYGFAAQLVKQRYLRRGRGWLVASGAANPEPHSTTSGDGPGLRN
ncbi:magnesium-translocating P-type ATPase [Mycolicibacterium sphagni]|uniref:Magnesium-transporting ATPase, P-type 1 n=1 Tax=Mycolicibacterium sphagni TaxID=1786 RepID=A0A255DUC4_9MYCO|nr:magnesium-translocating P-type ATPase [Mycolicibacterium sphagni]OYN82660.1 magnesium-translocating P-type ATPase [Mycolicibacterium sphagni]